MPGCLSGRHADSAARPTGGTAATSSVDSISLMIAAALTAGGGDGEASGSARGGMACSGAASKRVKWADDSGDSLVQEAAAPVVRGGAAGRAEEQQRISSIAVVALAQAMGECDIGDVLVPDVYTDDTTSSGWLLDSTGVSETAVRDETGCLIDWPWETGPMAPQRHTSGKRRRHRAFHRLDHIIVGGLLHSTAKGDMGANSTGVRRWKAFCQAEGISPHRAIDPNAPLAVKLEEEWLCMRFIAALMETGSVQPNSAATYFGSVQGWHAREHGVKLAAGLKLNRLPAMLKGLRRTMGSGGRTVRRGMAPQTLKLAMDRCLDSNNVEHANMRAALALAFQGLLRGAEFAVDGKFAPTMHITRGDIASISAERLVVMMRPCKNMQHLSGKTVPLIVGAGGEYIDAVAEMRNLLRVDPVPADQAHLTPMFRQDTASGGRVALTTRRVREWTSALMAAVNEDPAQYGAHSYRIGGATALFAAGADPVVIRTMGRWSSDCYRLYVRACFSQTLEWSRRCGSTAVNDVAAEFEEVDSY